MTSKSGVRNTTGIDAHPGYGQSLELIEEKPPSITAKGVTAAAFFWFCYALINAVLIAPEVPVSFGHLLAGQIVAALILALYSIPVWLLMMRRLYRTHWGIRLSLHIALAPLYGLCAYSTTTALFGIFGLGDAVRGMEQNRQWIVFAYIMTYGLQFALYHTAIASGRLRRRERQAHALRQTARRQELAALRSQLNPHFLFNTLHGINATIGTDPEKARVMLARLSDMLRYTLESGNRGVVSLAREVDFVQAYLSLEHMRFGDRFSVEYDVDPVVLTVSVPPMILQPIVENAVKHGVARSEQCEQVRITARPDGDRLRLGVENSTNGSIGVDGGSVRGENSDSSDHWESMGIGMRNVNERLTELFGPSFGLRMEQGDRTVSVSFSLPLHGLPEK